MSDRTIAPMGERAEHGMEQAAEHAERIYAEWKDDALQCVRQYLDLPHAAAGFLAEDVEGWAGGDVFMADPPDKRAWGAVMQRARREGLVRADGFRRDKWGSVKTVWRGVAR